MRLIVPTVNSFLDVHTAYQQTDVYNNCAGILDVFERHSASRSNNMLQTFNTLVSMVIHPERTKPKLPRIRVKNIKFTSVWVWTGESHEVVPKNQVVESVVYILDMALSNAVYHLLHGGTTGKERPVAVKAAMIEFFAEVGVHLGMQMVHEELKELTPTCPTTGIHGMHRDSAKATEYTSAILMHAYNKRSQAKQDTDAYSKAVQDEDKGSKLDEFVFHLHSASDKTKFDTANDLFRAYTRYCEGEKLHVEFSSNKAFGEYVSKHYCAAKDGDDGGIVDIRKVFDIPKSNRNNTNQYKLNLERASRFASAFSTARLRTSGINTRPTITPEQRLATHMAVARGQARVVACEVDKIFHQETSWRSDVDWHDVTSQVCYVVYAKFLQVHDDPIIQDVFWNTLVSVSKEQYCIRLQYDATKNIVLSVGPDM